MDLSPEVLSKKKDVTNSISDRKLDTSKYEFDYSGQSEIYIKTEVQEDESDIQESVGTCHQEYLNYEIPIEAMIKNEPQDQFDDSLQDPLDAGTQNQNQAAVGNAEHLSSESDEDIQYKMKEAGEKLQEEYQLIGHIDPESSGSGSTNENQVLSKMKQTKNKNFICHVCNKAFGLKSNLTTHLLIHTGEKPYECDICKKAFRQTSSLSSHMLIHTGIKPFACDVCEKVFKQVSELNRHKVIHTDLKPFSCDVCNKSFRRSSGLVIHKRIHTGEKPYVCQVCGAGFSASSDFNRHKSIHVEEKKFSCDICNKSFSLNAYLTMHKRTHTGEKPYSCDKCGTLFRTRSSLHVHKKFKHKK